MTEPSAVHNPFAHLQELSDEQRELKRRRLQNKPVRRCCVPNCGSEPCLQLQRETAAALGTDPATETVVHMCMPHFVAQADADEQLLRAGVVLLDEATFLSQSAKVGDLWQQAVGDLVLQMYALQRREESAARKDPLAVLSRNAPQKQKQLVRVLGGPVEHLQRSAAKAPTANARQHQVSASSSSSSSSSSAATNPYVRRDTDRSGSLFTGLGNGVAALQRMERAAREEEQAAEKAASTNPAAARCAACGSAWVSERNNDTMDGTRGEIWGSKDTPLLLYTHCKKCEHVETRQGDVA